MALTRQQANAGADVGRPVLTDVVHHVIDESL